MQKFLLVQQAVFKQIKSEDEATYCRFFCQMPSLLFCEIINTICKLFRKYHFPCQFWHSEDYVMWKCTRSWVVQENLMLNIARLRENQGWSEDEIKFVERSFCHLYVPRLRFRLGFRLGFRLVFRPRFTN